MKCEYVKNDDEKDECRNFKNKKTLIFFGLSFVNNGALNRFFYSKI